jgi:YggT family protein
MDVLADIIETLIQIYVYILIAAAIMSSLTAFNVINARSRPVYYLLSVLYRLTEPVLRPLRRIIPAIGGIDLTPLILILLLHFVGQPLLVGWLRRLALEGA